MKHSVDMAIQDPIWDDVTDLKKFTDDVIAKTLKAADMPDEAREHPVEISVVFANDDMVQVLNREYRGKDKPTNVLSFAMLDAEDNPQGDIIALGDIILAYETIEKEAKDQNKIMRDHLAHLLIHGTLHLLGYDHLEEDDANTMETLEIRILENLGIQNPYTDILSPI